MPTLVNYNQATFKNHAKPNKRRLQELQHSEARAHAARVAYWRKKGGPVAKPGQPQRSGSDKSSDRDSLSREPSDPGTIIKQESETSYEILHWKSDPSPHSGLAIEPASTTDIDHKSEQKLTPSSRSGSIATQTLPILDNGKWRRRSDTSSSYDSKLGVSCEIPVDSIRLARQPTSQLFDPFDSAPVHQGNEVVAAMDHCIPLPALTSTNFC